MGTEGNVITEAEVSERVEEATLLALRMQGGYHEPTRANRS